MRFLPFINTEDHKIKKHFKMITDSDQTSHNNLEIFVSVLHIANVHFPFKHSSFSAFGITSLKDSSLAFIFVFDLSLKSSKVQKGVIRKRF